MGNPERQFPNANTKTDNPKRVTRANYPNENFQPHDDQQTHFMCKAKFRRYCFFLAFLTFESIYDFWFLGDGLGNIRKNETNNNWQRIPGIFHPTRTLFGRHLFCIFLMLKGLRPIKHDGPFDVRVLDSSRYSPWGILLLFELRVTPALRVTVQAGRSLPHEI